MVEILYVKSKEDVPQAFLDVSQIVSVVRAGAVLKILWKSGVPQNLTLEDAKSAGDVLNDIVEIKAGKRSAPNSRWAKSLLKGEREFLLKEGFLVAVVEKQTDGSFLCTAGGCPGHAIVTATSMEEGKAYVERYRDEVPWGNDDIKEAKEKS